MKKDLVSIIVPCYNQAKYLDESLESVLNQTYDYWECIIVNDGSSDETEQVAKKWKRKDNRFKYIYKENGGLSSARNLGINKALGKFILPLDSDDKLGDNYIKLGVNAFTDNDHLKVVYCKAQKFGKENADLELADFNLVNLSRRNMIFCSALFRKNDWEQVGGYDVNMIYGWEDWELWIALLKNGGDVLKLDYFGFYYRITSDSMLKKINKEQTKFLLEYLSVKHADFFVKYYGSFVELEQLIKQKNNDFKIKLKSEKFVMNAFTKKFFGFRVFKEIEIDE